MVAAKPPECDTMYCGGDSPPGVALIQPPRRPIATPGLSDPSGSDLRVVSHDVKVLLVGYL